MRGTSASAITLTLISICCIDEYPMELPFTEPQLVVDALISSEPEQSYVTLGWTFPTGEGCFYDDSFPWRIPVQCPPDTTKGGQYLVTGRIRIEETSGNVYEFPVQMHERKSYVNIPMPDIVGTPGKKYRLDIEIVYNNTISIFTSETEMLQTPVISKVSYEIRKGDIGKSDNFVPLIYFEEPQEQKNFYLFRLCEVYGGQITYCASNSRVWNYSIISDEFLPEHVNGLSIDDGATVAKYAEFYPHPNPGLVVQVRMYSVTHESYKFYKALLEQFNNDGAAYSPVPANPPGNISGGAIGLFRAVHQSAGEVSY